MPEIEKWELPSAIARVLEFKPVREDSQPAWELPNGDVVYVDEWNPADDKEQAFWLLAQVAEEFKRVIFEHTERVDPPPMDYWLVYGSRGDDRLMGFSVIGHTLPEAISRWFLRVKGYTP